MKWNDNSPADRIPSIFKKQMLLFYTITSICSFGLLLLLMDDVPYLPIISVLLFSAAFVFAAMGIYEIVILPSRIAFTDREIVWKTKAGKTDKMDYLHIKSVAPTYRKSLKNNKPIPFEEELYSAIFERGKPTSTKLSKNRWAVPPFGIVLNRENTKILIERLKEIDPELKNVEISGWGENE